MYVSKILKCYVLLYTKNKTTQDRVFVQPDISDSVWVDKFKRHVTFTNKLWKHILQSTKPVRTTFGGGPAWMNLNAKSTRELRNPSEWSSSRPMIWESRHPYPEFYGGLFFWSLSQICVSCENVVVMLSILRLENMYCICIVVTSLIGGLWDHAQIVTTLPVKMACSDNGAFLPHW